MKTLGKKKGITSRQPERQKTRSSIFTITLHLHPTIIGRLLFTGMEATGRDNPLKHVIIKSLEALRDDFNKEPDHKRSSTGTPIFATPPVRVQDHTHASRTSVSGPCWACTGLLLQERNRFSTTKPTWKVSDCAPG